MRAYSLREWLYFKKKYLRVYSIYLLICLAGLIWLTYYLLNIPDFVSYVNVVVIRSIWATIIIFYISAAGLVMQEAIAEQKKDKIVNVMIASGAKIKDMWLSGIISNAITATICYYLFCCGYLLACLVCMKKSICFTGIDMMITFFGLPVLGSSFIFIYSTACWLVKSEMGSLFLGVIPILAFSGEFLLIGKISENTYFSNINLETAVILILASGCILATCYFITKKIITTVKLERLIYSN